MDKKLIGEYLLAAHKITDAQLQSALERQATSMVGGKMPLLGTVLVEMGAVTERDLEAKLEEQARDQRQASGPMPPPRHSG